MAGKTRETTSVSTLEAKVTKLIEFAVANKRRDILLSMVEIKPRMDAMVASYNKLRSEIDPLYLVAFPKLEVSDSAIALALAELEANKTE